MNRILFLSVAALLVQAAACGSSQSSPASQSHSNLGNGGNSSGVSGGDSGNSSGDSGNVTPPPPDDSGSGGPVVCTPPADPVLPASTSTLSGRLPVGNGYYIVAKPANYNAANSYPLVLVLHGDGDRAEDISGFYPLHRASGNDAIVVYPSGLQAIGWQKWPLNADNPYANPDMAFLRDVINDVKNNYNIDAKRVFGAGYSSGGHMVNQVACATNLFRAIASNAGVAASVDDAGNPPGHCAGPVAAIIVHGTRDYTDTLDGGIWSARFWADQNGCQDTWDNINIPNDFDPQPMWKEYQCPRNNPVTLGIMPCTGHSAESPKWAWDFFQTVPSL